MKRIPKPKLEYLPVMGPTDDELALKLTSNVMINAIYPWPQKHLDKLAGKRIVCCDSGGLQILDALENLKVVDVGPMLRPVLDDEEVFTLGTISNCREYRRTGSTMALMVDYPVKHTDTDAVYQWKLGQSIRAREMILRASEKLCPGTDMVIALQPRHPGEIEDYFDRISDPRVGTYGFPVRKRNRPSKMPEIACALSFLHERGIRRVHLLGSSAACIIMVAAYAQILGLFERVSFDSFTWRQRFRNPTFLHPETLDSWPEDHVLNSKADMRLLLRAFGVDVDAVLAGLHVPEKLTVKQGIGIYNIRAIQRFADRLLGMTIGEFQGFLSVFPKYWDGKAHIRTALCMLEYTKELGHEAMINRFMPEAARTPFPRVA